VSFITYGNEKTTAEKMFAPISRIFLQKTDCQTFRHQKTFCDVSPLWVAQFIHILKNKNQQPT
jgi:hypothetical protein